MQRNPVTDKAQSYPYAVWADMECSMTMHVLRNSGRAYARASSKNCRGRQRRTVKRAEVGKVGIVHEHARDLLINIHAFRMHIRFINTLQREKVTSIPHMHALHVCATKTWHMCRRYAWALNLPRRKSHNSVIQMHSEWHTRKLQTPKTLNQIWTYNSAATTWSLQTHKEFESIFFVELAAGTPNRSRKFVHVCCHAYRTMHEHLLATWFDERSRYFWFSTHAVRVCEHLRCVTNHYSDIRSATTILFRYGSFDTSSQLQILCVQLGKGM